MGTLGLQRLGTSDLESCSKRILEGCEQDHRVGNMGRKTDGIYIHPKQFGNLPQPCIQEMMTFLNCLSLTRNSDEKCVRQKDLLSACMNAQSGKKKNPWGSINYHLQRLSRGRK